MGSGSSQTSSARSAVLVIDVQAGLFSSKPPPFAAAAVLDRINQITEKARAAGVPPIFLQHDGRAEENVRPHTDGWNLHPKLLLQPGDLVIRKTTCDAFYRTPLEAELRSRGITALILTGFATDFCIDSTLRNAVSKNFSVTVVADAHTTNDGPHLSAGQIIAHHNYAWANCTTEQPVKVLKAHELKFADKASA